MTRPRAAPLNSSILTVFLQIAALTALALGQPLLQLVKDNPEFLTVHHSQGWDVVILATVLLLVAPAIPTALVVVAGLLSRRLGRLVQAAVLGALLTLILLPILDRLPALTGWLTLTLAAAAGAAFAVAFARSRFIRQNLAVLALVVPVFLMLFLASAPIRALLSPAAAPATARDHSVTAPVVMIILDELPTSSLLGPNGDLDCQLFPNFCRLAGLTTWYRNATSISGATLRSVPAILSGKRPQWRETPSFADHPDNIFSLLAGSHDISALEVQTSLCPAELTSETRPELAARLELLLVDLGVLYEHVVVPESWRDRLVPVSDKWGDFLASGDPTGGGADEASRIREFEEFVDSLEAGARPRLVVAHILLPHSPFQYLPDGRRYKRREKIPALPDGTWGADPEVIAHSYRRHLLQVAAVDRLVGRLIDRLEDLDLLDDAALVVTADHGISFQAGLNRRQYVAGNEADIMFVPLFIKTPGQEIGAVDDRFVQSLDIMPTVASAVGCELGWEVAGMDLLTGEGDRDSLLFMDQDQKQARVFPREIVRERDAAVAWKHDLFGTQGGIERLFTAFDPAGILGREVGGLTVRPHGTLRGRILDELDLKNVDLEGPFLPAEINGLVEGYSGEQRLVLALALDGVIAGASRTYADRPDPETCRWQITVAPDALHAGANRAELFVLDETETGVDLLQIPLFTPSFLGRNLGGARVAGIGERGLFGSHQWDGRATRWTDGEGRWTIPLKADEHPQLLTIGLKSSGPAGATLSVTANGTRLLTQFLPRGRWETRLPLDGIDCGDELTVVLESGVFVPAEVNPESNDRRSLGVAVQTLLVE